MSNIVKGSGLIYTTGQPNTIPVQGYDSEFAIDVNGNQYAWNRTTLIWDNLGQAIEIATSSVAPTHTPSNFRPRFVVTPNRTLYFHSGSEWGIVTPPGTFSSSGQVGPTGIYSGSGTVPSGTRATSYIPGYPLLYTNMLFGDRGWYQNNYGDNFYQFGLESVGQNDESGFIGFTFEGTQVYYPKIFCADSIVGSSSYINMTPYRLYLGSNEIQLNDPDFGNWFQFVSGRISTMTPSGRGIEYVGNYTGSFVSSSLISKLYADTQISLTSSFAATSASLIAGRGGIYNGSGNLSGNTFVNTLNNILYIGDSGNVYNGYGLVLDTLNGFIQIGDVFDSSERQIQMSDGHIIIYNLAGSLDFDSNHDVIIFQDRTSTQAGIQYDGDYSATFTNRSLVDKGYVDARSSSLNDTMLYNTGYLPSGAKIPTYLTPSNNTTQYLFGVAGRYQSELSDGFKQTGIESWENNDEFFGFIGFDEETPQRVIIKSSKQNVFISAINVDSSQIQVISNNIIIEDTGSDQISLISGSGISVSTLSGKGIEYASNYSASFTSRSLVDKDYSDNNLKNTFATQLDHFYYGTQPEGVNTTLPAISASSYFIHRVTFTSSLDVDKCFVGFRFTNDLVSASLYRNYGMPMHGLMVPDSTSRTFQFANSSIAGLYSNAFLVYKDYSKAVRLYSPPFGHEVSGSTELYNKLTGKGVPVGILSYSDMGNILVGHYSAGGNTRGSFYTGNASVICESMWFEQTGSNSVLSIALRNTGITVSTSSIMQVYKILF